MNDLIISLKISDYQIINSLILFSFFLLIAFISRFIITKVLFRLAKFTKSDIDDKIFDSLKNPIFYSIVFIGIHSCITPLEIQDLYKLIMGRILNTFLVLFWMSALFKITRILTENAIYKLFSVTGLSKDLAPLLVVVAKIAIFLASLMAILSIWHIDITPLVASAGIASAVIAFAAKDTIANFFGGISVFLDKPYKITDYIELDSGERGEVVEIGIRSTRIKTRDDVLISIPNSIIANSKIINESAPIASFRVRVPIGVAYGSDIDLIEQVLIDIALKNENIIIHPEPRVRFRKFGDSSLDFELLAWAHEPSLRGKTIHDINREIYKKFAELGVSIPFPQRDLHIVSDKTKEH